MTTENINHVRIRYLGRYLPKHCVTTDELQKAGYLVESDDVFFKGVNSRHWADDSESTLYMGTQAAKDLLVRYDVDPASLDLIIFSALLGDYVSPQSASGIQYAIQAVNATAITLDTGCASFVSGVNYGALLIRSGAFNRVLVISVANFAGRAQSKVKHASATIPGDGAGAILLERSHDDDCALLAHYEKSFGQHHGLFAIHAIDEQNQPTHPWKPSQSLAFRFDSELVEQIKENARYYLPMVMQSCLQQANMDSTQVDVLFTHQPNQFLLDYWRNAMHISQDKHIHTLKQYGNLFQASIPISMVEAVENNKLQAGQVVLLASFAFAGELASASLIRFG